MASDDEQNYQLVTILLVEPNPGDTRLFTESFKDAKLKNDLYTVSDADAALDFVNQRGEYTDHPRPDFILLEPKLPGKSGIDVLTELDDEPTLREIPVVVLMSSKMGEDIVKSHGLDADHYVQKPVEPEDYIEFAQEIEGFSMALVQEESTDN
ncbi:response regulator receiver protein [Natronococcus amylolyticus DSM 10524]|uniref:Response regulator receiver protein n=1 Tax=Natronococcus amylolyticus DSM 10524 TaxID=1227497 RepID=L9X1H2_9EURY|nr:response regulator [Natronococcus amylolyticus]ELY55609.1 response regulator receiver protein [Natronococcus amylolyticus DSM 10524]